MTSLIVTATGVTILMLSNRSVEPPRLMNSIQLTNDGHPKDLQYLLTDGPHVWFLEEGDGWRTVPAVGGEPEPVGEPKGFRPSDVSVDGLGILGCILTEGVRHVGVWAIGGAVRYVGDLRGDFPVWSADRSRVAYGAAGNIFVANADGSGSRTVATEPFGGDVDSVTWSPDQQVLRFTMESPKDSTRSLWEVGVDGGTEHELLPGWNSQPYECCGKWTPDGRWYVFQAAKNGRTDIWALPYQRRFLGPSPKPVPVTAGPLDYYAPTPSKDGTKLFVIGEEKRPQLEVYSSKRREFTPYLGDLKATQVDFSRDGRWMAYVVLSSHTLWRCRVNGTERLQLTSPPRLANEPHWSPDGREIAFMEVSADQHYRIGIVPSAGGEVRHPVPGDDGQGVPTWSPDGTQIVFGEPLYRRPASETEIHLFDFKTGRLATLPGSEGLWTARWSPDGRYIAALVNLGSGTSPELRVFDVAHKTWRELVRIPYINEPTWSGDAKYIYFDTGASQAPALYRVRLADRRLEMLASLVRERGGDGWSGLAPDGSPLISHDVSFQEVYALQIQWP